MHTTDTVARLAVRLPAASRVFQRHDIDFCCGGNRPLDEACAEAGISAAAVLDEIAKESEARPDGVRWDERPLGELVEHILAAYHRPLDEELPRLAAMAQKVFDVHGDKDPERLRELRAVTIGLTQELADHMMKEERILFPWIQSGNGRMAGGPINVMNMEHDSAAESLRRIRELTDNFVPPPHACNTWRALWLGLQEFDRSLREHIHLENNVLFPRALSE